MKKTRIFRYLFLILIAAGIYSCEDMTDNYYKYIKDGETVYLVRPDSVESYAGNGRVLIKCMLKNAFNVDKIWVYWNEGHDSTSFDFVQSADIDMVDMMITGLDEKSYIFDIYTKNTDGNSSVKVTTFSSAYGERYRAALYPRIPSGFSCDTVDATMTWLASDESEDVTELKYTNLSGIENRVSLSTDTTKLRLWQFSDAGAVTYRSFYKPEATAIDSFATDWTTYQLPAAYAMFKTVIVTPKTGGANVVWENPTNSPVSVKVQYLSNTSVLTTKVFKTSPGSVTGLNTNTRDFKVTFIESSGNTFGPKVFKVTPL